MNALDADGDAVALAAGQTVSVVSASPTVVLTPDAAPGIDPKTNIQSVASGTVAIGPGPVIGTAVNVTATLLAADGVTVIDTETDTVGTVASRFATFVFGSTSAMSPGATVTEPPRCEERRTVLPDDAMSPLCATCA